MVKSNDGKTYQLNEDQLMIKMLNKILAIKLFNKVWKLKQACFQIKQETTM